VSLTSFHPLVARWFADTLGAPTSAQLRGWAAIRDGRHTLIAAPTGSGKTLAAFLSAIDDLVREGLERPLPDEVRVLYISPLKALSADIHKNLAEPRVAIERLAVEMGLPAPRITAGVRTGDTPAAQRAAMLRTPPHILVTTPESLYLLLTSARSRAMLATVRTVIVDEIHAVIGTRRGAHLALSLERLEQVCASGPPEGGPHTIQGDSSAAVGFAFREPVEADVGTAFRRPVQSDVGAAFRRPVLRPIQRIGLSATQNPVELVARFLVGADEARGACAIVDDGHVRERDLGVEIPRSPLDAVMSHEVWDEYYDRLTELVLGHKTTLIFVNTRKLAERVARHLSERLGDDQVTAHHGSLSKAMRLDAEHRLKTGALKALVATASLELGIDIGHIDLVCQIGSPHRIATLLQRVGRAGHTIHGVPKGRLLPVSRDDLIECAALLRAVRRGALDQVVTHDAPLDVLAQQIAAETACREYAEPDLAQMVRRAWPYRDLPARDFEQVLAMLSEGFATRRGRRAALVHRDEVHSVVRGRRGSRMLALTSGGAIPEVADYRVILEPEETFIGSVNEDFAIESTAGDIFQLGNASWQIRQVVAGTVRVADAHGAPPTIPFWLGEAPARSDELSQAVSDLRAVVDGLLSSGGSTRQDPPDVDLNGDRRADPVGPATQAVEWLEAETGIDHAAALQAIEYLSAGRQALGVIPTQDALVLERFFDESGGQQLVLHAPFGSRINKAWGLALRKRFCRQFNFELQAAATEDALMLSLGPQHSFPLADVFRYLHPTSVRDILVQAFLDAPVFATRWRWNATISLAVPRSRGGKKVPAPLQRMQSDDLMAAVFPDAAACLENIPGDRELPDHPLVNQTIRDCLEEAMDLAGLVRVLSRIHEGELRLFSRDTPEPSVFADEILNARPYAFLDDAPLEERRAQAVQTRSARDRRGDDLGALDAGAIERVRDEARPDPRDPDELHDALMIAGYLLHGEAPGPLCQALAEASRATRVGAAWVAAERLPEMLAVHPDAVPAPPIAVPASRAARAWTRPEALVELMRSRVAVLDPTTSAALAGSLALPTGDVDAALLTLESEGVVLRGAFTPGARSREPGALGREPAALEWCDRRLLARIHRYTLNRLRAEISAVTPADFMRHLFAWQHVSPASRLTGPEGLRAVVTQLDGLELPARAWERDVLPARIEGYQPALLDILCLTGGVGWAKLSSGPAQVVGATPIALFLREQMESWMGLRAEPATTETTDPGLTPEVAGRLEAAPTSRVLEHLRAHGACFRHEIAARCGLSDQQMHDALGQLVAQGLASSDGFSGLRSLITERPDDRGGRRGSSDQSGRWFERVSLASSVQREASIETLAWTLLRRYGVVFRRLLARETDQVTWRELTRVYRRLEARGEIRGGRFVSGMSGEQFALPEAVDHLREIRRSRPDGSLITISAADPLNLTGIVSPGDRIRTVTGNRVVYRNGVAIAAMEGDMLRMLAETDPATAAAAAAAAAGRRVSVVSGYVGRVG
jgi:ATP-dependent Lhr-like helicase